MVLSYDLTTEIFFKKKNRTPPTPYSVVDPIFYIFLCKWSTVHYCIGVTSRQGHNIGVTSEAGHEDQNNQYLEYMMAVWIPLLFSFDCSPCISLQSQGGSMTSCNCVIFGEDNVCVN